MLVIIPIIKVVFFILNSLLLYLVFELTLFLFFFAVINIIFKKIQ